MNILIHTSNPIQCWLQRTTVQTEDDEDRLQSNLKNASVNLNVFDSFYVDKAM